MKNDGKVYFVENSIYSLKIDIKLKRKRNFSILKFYEKWWKSKFCWKLYLFTNNSYKTKNNSKFFNFENFIKFYSMKNDGKVIFVENYLFTNISYKTKKNLKFINFENFKNFFQWKMMEKLFLLKTLSIH